MRTGMGALGGRLALAALLLAQAGCGYSTGLRLAPGYGSVGVEIFGNDSQVRDIERDFHTALTAVLRDRLQAPLSAPGEADLVLRGDILDVHFRPGIRTTGNVLVETGLTVRARASLWDPEHEEVVAGPVVRATQVGYAVDDPAGESEARRRALDNLAERVVLDLLAPLSVPPDASVTGEGPARPPRR